MRDRHILSYVGQSVWAITPAKWAEIVPALIRHAKGTEAISAEAISAFMDARAAEPADVRRQGANVAVIPVSGVIAHRMDSLDASSGGTSCEAIAKMFHQAMADESVGTIVMRYSTPGGTAQGVAELAKEIFEGRGRGTKQIISMIDGQASSAGYWLASQADEVVCIPSGFAGSIGVFTVHQDLSAALEKEGIKVTVIKAGKYKFEGNPFEPLSDEARAHRQKLVTDTHEGFMKDVARGRGVSVDDVRNGYGEGRELSAKDALKAGLIDRIATFDQVLSKLVGGGRQVRSSIRAEGDQPSLSAAEEPPAKPDPAPQPPAPSVDPDAAIRERIERI